MCEYEGYIFDKSITKNIFEQIEHIHNVLIKFKMLSIQNYEKSINIFFWFESVYHFWNVFGVSSFCISQAWRINVYNLSIWSSPKKLFARCLYCCRLYTSTGFKLILISAHSIDQWALSWACLSNYHNFCPFHINYFFNDWIDKW
jgi:hypothetical protein